MVSSDGYQPGEHGEVPDAAALLALASGRELSLILPARVCAWHRVQLPSRALAGRRLLNTDSPLQALLQNALEDDLLVEPAQLHLAVQKLDGASGACWVLACPRDWLQQVLAQLHEAGLHVERLLSEFGPLPDLTEPATGETAASNPGAAGSDDGPVAQLHVTGSPEDAWLTCCTPATVWRLRASSPALELVSAGKHGEYWSDLRAEPRVAALAQQLTGQQPSLQNASERWLERLQAGENLAQFDFAYLSGQRWKKTIAFALQRLAHAPDWRVPRLLLASLLVVNLLGLEAYAWVENQRVRDQKAVLAAQFREAFPTVPLVLAPEEQMSREVSLLRRAAGAPDPQGLDTLLGLVAGLSGAAGADRVDYEARVLRLHAPGMAPDVLQARSADVRARGYAISADERGLSVHWLEDAP